MEMLGALWESFSGLLMQVLPVSPFAVFYAQWEAPQWLGWLNWLFPVGDCVRVMSVWLVAVGVYYLYSIIMRWLRVIG